MDKIWKSLPTAAALIAAVLLFTAPGGSRAGPAEQDGVAFDASSPVTPHLSRSVRDLPVQETGMGPTQLEDLISRAEVPAEPTGGPAGALTADRQRAAETSPGLLFDFEGLESAGFPISHPDPAADVGPNHFVLMVNLSFAVYDKSGTMVAGPTAFIDLFDGAGGVCETDIEGRPNVLYDSLADRWLLSMYADPIGSQGLCVAVSKTPDPAGTYWTYEFILPDFPLQPKFGVWTDAYYLGTSSGFSNLFYAHALDRDSMLAGAPAARQSFGGQPNFMMPADIDGDALPPEGDPGLFYTFLKDGYPNHPPGVDRIELYTFDVDWVTPGNSTFTLLETLPISPFTYTVCGFSFSVQGCIPQPATENLLQSSSNFPMWRLAYRNLGAHEALVGNFSVDAGGDHAAIRWFELRNAGSGWSLQQEGTHAPDADHRWMGSIAMDGSGNIALGYSVSGETTNPSLRYTTRLAGDPAGTLKTEAELIAGGGVQTGLPNWGTYSSMVVDPVDHCTFWFVGEYHDVTDSGYEWNTRVGVFKEPGCTGDYGFDFTISTDPTELTVCPPDDAVYDVDVGSIQGFSDPVSLSTAGEPGGTSTSFSVNPVNPPGSSVLTIGNTGAAANGDYTIEVIGMAATSTHTTTVNLTLLDSAPGAPGLVSPANGASGVSRRPTYSWNPLASADSYLLQVAADSGFTSIVYSKSGLIGTSHTQDVPLDPFSTYYWRVRGMNTCGNGAYSTARSFTTLDPAPILLIDDDDDNPDVQPWWTDALDMLGLDYDVWETGALDFEPNAADLAPYETVMWFSGDRFGPNVGSGPAGPGADAEDALGDWLDAGACLLISSQEYHYDAGLTTFMGTYLGVMEIQEDGGAYDSVSGTGVFDGLGPYPLTPVGLDGLADEIVVDQAIGEEGMVGDNMVAALTRAAAVYRTAFFAFGLEALPSGGMEAAISSFLDFCDPPPPPDDFIIYLPVVMKQP